jgi:hypothetical protein
MLIYALCYSDQHAVLPDVHHVYGLSTHAVICLAHVRPRDPPFQRRQLLMYFILLSVCRRARFRRVSMRAGRGGRARYTPEPCSSVRSPRNESAHISLGECVGYEKPLRSGRLLLSRDTNPPYARDSFIDGVSLTRTVFGGLLT